MRKAFLPVIGLGMTIIIVLVLLVLLVGGGALTLAFFKGDIFNIVAMCALLVLAWALIQSAGISLAAGDGNLVMPLLMLFSGIGAALLGLSFIVDVGSAFGLSIVDDIVAPVSGGESLSQNSTLIIIAAVALLLYAASNKKLRNKLPKWVK